MANLDKKADLAGPGVGTYEDLEKELPIDYEPLQSPMERMKALFALKAYIEENLCKELNLQMVQVPLIVDRDSGVNDYLDRDGSRTPVEFPCGLGLDKPIRAQVVQAATKWKRMALKQFGCRVGEGICTDMKAVRKDYFLDHDHSSYVDQWDWERVITEKERNLDFLKEVVNKIWKVIYGAGRHVQEKFPALATDKYPDFPETLQFFHAEEILDRYPDLPRKQRETIMLQDVAHSRSGGDIIAKIVSGQGWTITGKAVYPTGSSDFTRGLKAASENGTQVLLIWMDMPESAVLLRQWYEMKIPALPFGSIISAAEGPDFWEKMGKAGEFCLANVVNAGNAPSTATPTTMAFYKAYSKRWGIAPEGYGTSSSYMAPFVLKDAIERANSLDTDKVIAALESTNFLGVYGRIRFGKRNHQVIPSFDPQEGAVGSIFQWQGGERMVVFPSSIAKSTIKLPPWMKPVL